MFVSLALAGTTQACAKETLTKSSMAETINKASGMELPKILFSLAPRSALITFSI